MKKAFFVWLVVLVGVFNVQARFSGAESIKIAAIFARTGEAAQLGDSALEGARIAVEEINKEGGMSGREVELVVLDDQSSAIGSRVSALKAVEAGVLAIIGAEWSSNSLVVARIAQEHKIPMITSISTHPDITRAGDYIFRTCFTDCLQGEVLARFVVEDLKARSAVVFINVSSDYSMRLTEEFRNAFERMGGKILAERSYIQKERHFKQALEGIRELSPDVLFLSGYEEGGLIAREARSGGIGAIPVGGDGLSIFYQANGEYPGKAYFTTHWSDEVHNEDSRRFVERYQKLYPIRFETILTYDAVRLLADAVRRAGSTDRARVREALSATQGFRGLSGPIELDSNRDPLKDVVVMELREGRPRYLKTIKPAVCTSSSRSGS